MELVGFSERYSSCLHPLCTHVTTVTLLIQIHLTLRSWGSEGCTRPLAGWQEWGEKRVPVHHCLLTPPVQQLPWCWDRVNNGLQHPFLISR